MLQNDIVTCYNILDTYVPYDISQIIMNYLLFFDDNPIMSTILSVNRQFGNRQYGIFDPVDLTLVVYQSGTISVLQMESYKVLHPRDLFHDISYHDKMYFSLEKIVHVKWKILGNHKFAKRFRVVPVLKWTRRKDEIMFTTSSRLITWNYITKVCNVCHIPKMRHNFVRGKCILCGATEILDDPYFMGPYSYPRSRRTPCYVHKTDYKMSKYSHGEVYHRDILQ